MTQSERLTWDERYRGERAREAAPALLEVLAMLPRGRALDVAAGLGRNSLALARAGIKTVAVDFSVAAMLSLSRQARAENLPILAVVADLEQFPISPVSYDVIINFDFLDRNLIPTLKQALRPKGMLLFETFLINQAELGHPRNPAYLLRHHELRELMKGLELLRYREGLVVDRRGQAAWRASALAKRIG